MRFSAGATEQLRLQQQQLYIYIYMPLGLQVPFKKVFGVGLEGPNISKYLLRRYLEP